MFKKSILLLLLGTNIHAMNHVDQEGETSSNTWSTTKKIAVFGAIGVGAGAAAAVCAPALLAGGSIVGAKAAAVTLAAKAGISTGAAAAAKGAVATAVWTKSYFVAAPLTAKISMSIWGGYGVKWVKECFYPTPEQELAQFIREESSEPSFEMQVKEAFKKKQKLHTKKS